VRKKNITTFAASFNHYSMPENIDNKRKGFFSNLKHTYRFVLFKDNFDEVWHLRITAMNVLSIAGTVIIILIFGSMALVMFTPLRQLVPGYPNNAMRDQIYFNAMRLDSLEHEIHLRDQYINAVNAIVLGREPETAEDETTEDIPNYDNITFTRSEQDSLLRRQVEEEERYNIVIKRQTGALPYSDEVFISKIHLFKPVSGVVSNKFDINSNHFGIDLVAAPNEVVKSILDGTVIMSVWTAETGYVIQIQHAANIISVYKHNASLLKKQGDRVKVGEAIAIMGNSGELTSGPHLHLEIWQNGIPVNPEDYIVF
jgi:murein DD-endopeptidase MepM/ murein hydrolase activator NlpD